MSQAPKNKEENPNYESKDSDLSDLDSLFSSPTQGYKEPDSAYHRAWILLRETKELTLSLKDPRSERTIREAIIEYKKKDPYKDPLLRLKIKKGFNPETKKYELRFSLYKVTRSHKNFFNI